MSMTFAVLLDNFSEDVPPHQMYSLMIKAAIYSIAYIAAVSKRKHNLDTAATSLIPRAASPLLITPNSVRLD